ncbi:DNA-binding response regulator [Saccharopolyspora rhizosphaerae]|uniref:DNA-binding response regulator n=1 Tax=Saccharopolyspora rhizosphaerae TaxID=2492662 RepID=A0A3R8P026_9PSEU|nr:response regulator transcription factor [Saccharopolyspora rhizosphaerae]RRO17002.1 DNA-binding response regulator [Saccharopolyspora rhizosphaerae]
MNTKIFLIGMPRLMREIIARAVEQHPELVVVGERAQDADRLLEAIDEAGANTVILDVAPPTSAEVLVRLFEQRPRTVLVVVRDGREVFRCEPLGELSPQALVRAAQSP